MNLVVIVWTKEEDRMELKERKEGNVLIIKLLEKRIFKRIYLIENIIYFKI